MKRISPIAVFLFALIISLATAYYLVLYLPGKEAEPRLSLKDICTEEAIEEVNWLINGEQNVFGKARAVVALENHPCLEGYPTLIERAEDLVEKEKEQVESVDELVKFEQDAEKMNSLETLHKKEIDLFKAELKHRAMKELERLMEKYIE